jgi:alcohol dehydrogenase class IV
MPYVLKANRSAIEEKIARLTRYLGLTTAGFDGFLDWVIELRAQLGIPNTLAEIDIDDSDSETVGDMAVADPSAGGNPISFSSDEYQRIFQAAVAGHL